MTTMTRPSATNGPAAGDAERPVPATEAEALASVEAAFELLRQQIDG